MEPRHVNPEVPLKGHWKAIKDEKENNVTLDLWLEEEGFFRLKFEEVSKEQKGNFTSNEESGHYSSAKDGTKVKLEFMVVEREWKWKDGSDEEGGIDATDLKYAAELNEDKILITYVEKKYICTKLE